jgi:hypothetical protein
MNSSHTELNTLEKKYIDLCILFRSRCDYYRYLIVCSIIGVFALSFRFFLNVHVYDQGGCIYK